VRKPQVIIFTRHAATCPQRRHEQSQIPCGCAKWLRWSEGGKQYREPANTRVWGVALEKREEKQRDLDGLASPKAPVEGIRERLETFISLKENAGAEYKAGLRSQLGRFVTFCESRGRSYVSEIQHRDCEDFRKIWSTFWPSPIKRARVAANLRSFLRDCGWGDAAVRKAFPSMRVEAQQPAPYTPAELKRLIEQVPKSFANAPERVPVIQGFIKAAASLGTARVDTIQINKAVLLASEKTGVYSYQRQKTGKRGYPRISAALREELLALPGETPFLFRQWDAPASYWAKAIAGVMKDAGLHTQGNSLHRLRDSAIDAWFAAGFSTSDVAAAAGDSVTMIEQHYEQRASEARQKHFAALPAIEI